MEELQQGVQANYILSYMFQAPYFITQGFKYNNEVQEKLFNYMCNCEEYAYWRIRIRAISSYIGVDISKDQ